ncbi:hypothetical protein F3Y22_tig00110430pilonHSYRG00205 [Hibiscus syriacus]|uniref:Uncharacterized protein n=1 Tax=Hibiscus syriacus TaxID=106335 RepID=A0A6A3AQ87_HIBSY|nr:hypothetical protein F3Y22_tig00110430pilonHSYRG00205 [Hibiscus syriacus]
MGCGISKFDIPKEGDASRVYTRLSVVHRSNDRLSRTVQREEACIDKESSGEEDLYGGDEGIPYMQSPSFRVYCVPSQLDDGISEGDSTPAEIKEGKKMDAQSYKKKVTKF